MLKVICNTFVLYCLYNMAVSRLLSPRRVDDSNLELKVYSRAKKVIFNEGIEFLLKQQTKLCNGAGVEYMLQYLSKQSTARQSAVSKSKIKIISCLRTNLFVDKTIKETVVNC